MKKVIYSVTKLGKQEHTKITGIGYVNDDELVTACMSKNGKPYIRIFNCVKDCKPTEKENEFSGNYYELVEINDREVEINYFVWYKIAE